MSEDQHNDELLPTKQSPNGKYQTKLGWVLLTIGLLVILYSFTINDLVWLIGGFSLTTLGGYFLLSDLQDRRLEILELQSERELILEKKLQELHKKSLEAINELEEARKAGDEITESYTIDKIDDNGKVDDDETTDPNNKLNDDE